MKAPLVQLEGVTRAYQGRVAVDRLDLEIFDGEFFALLGPSGCGKTTLLRLLAGFDPPDAGRVMLDGEDISQRPPHARPVHMMFQSYALFPHLNVAQNIAFGLKQQRLPRPEIAARVDEMLSLVRLDGLHKRRVDQLSGGQRQRVALARALAPRPRILLLDEPLAALDRKLREETRFELMEIRKRLGSTFVIVTHDQEEAMVLADRLAVMRAGRIVQTGAPAEVYEQPRDRYVADFLGEVNLIGAEAAGREGAALRFASGEVGGPLLAAEGPDLHAGEGAWLAVRPEKLVLHQDAPPPGPNRMAGRVVEMGYLGDWTIHMVEIAPGRRLRAARANAERHVARPMAIGDQVWLTFAPDAAVVLTS